MMLDLTKHSLAEEDLLSRLNDIWVNPSVTEEDTALFAKYSLQLSRYIKSRIPGLHSYHSEAYVITQGFDPRACSILARFHMEDPQIMCLTKAYPLLDALYDLQLHPMTQYLLEELKAMHLSNIYERDQVTTNLYHDHTDDQYGLLHAKS